jgi:hypothetical protein
VKIHRTGIHSPNVRRTMNRSPHPMAVTFRSNFVTRRHRPQCFDLIAVRCITHTLSPPTSAAESGLRQGRRVSHGRFGGTGSWGTGLTRTGEMSNEWFRCLRLPIAPESKTAMYFSANRKRPMFFRGSFFVENIGVFSQPRAVRPSCSPAPVQMDPDGDRPTEGCLQTTEQPQTIAELSHGPLRPSGSPRPGRSVTQNKPL